MLISSHPLQMASTNRHICLHSAVPVARSHTPSPDKWAFLRYRTFPLQSRADHVMVSYKCYHELARDLLTLIQVSMTSTSTDSVSNHRKTFLLSPGLGSIRGILRASLRRISLQRRSRSHVSPVELKPTHISAKRYLFRGQSPYSLGGVGARLLKVWRIVQRYVSAAIRHVAVL